MAESGEESRTEFKTDDAFLYCFFAKSAFARETVKSLGDDEAATGEEAVGAVGVWAEAEEEAEEPEDGP